MFDSYTVCMGIFDVVRQFIKYIFLFLSERLNISCASYDNISANDETDEDIRRQKYILYL